jgi:hypothetical protein
MLGGLVIMSWEYQKYTNGEKIKMEQEFRHLLSIIPVWRQVELISMEKESAERKVAQTLKMFEDHWTAKFTDCSIVKENDNA